MKLSDNINEMVCYLVDEVREMASEQIGQRCDFCLGASDGLVIIVGILGSICDGCAKQAVKQAKEARGEQARSAA